MSNETGIKKIVENWKVVLLSLIGATTFWFFNALNKEYSAMVSYPIEFDLEKDSVIIMQPLPDVIDIDVSGGGWNLFRSTLWFSVDPIRVQLDNPTDIRFLTRSTLMPIVKDHLNNLNVNFLYSDTLNIHIENKIIKKVNLVIDSTNINLETGHRIVSPITITPDTVTITGPETIIKSLQNDYYLMVPDQGIDDDVLKRLTIPLPFDNIMSASPNQLAVAFEVDRFDRKRINVPVDLINFPEDQSVALSDSSVTIFYVIQRRKDESFTARDFNVSLDYNMLESPDSLIQPLLIYAPEVTSELEISPAKIKLIARPNAN